MPRKTRRCPQCHGTAVRATGEIHYPPCLIQADPRRYPGGKRWLVPEPEVATVFACCECEWIERVSE